MAAVYKLDDAGFGMAARRCCAFDERASFFDRPIDRPPPSFYLSRALFLRGLLSILIIITRSFDHLSAHFPFAFVLRYLFATITLRCCESRMNEIAREREYA